MEITPEQLKAVRKAARAQAEKLRHHPDVDASDIEQETWLSILTAKKPFDASKSRFSTFANMMASRRAVDLHRHNERRPVQALGEYDAPELERVAIDAPDMPEWVREIRLAVDRRRKGGMRGRSYTRGQEAAIALIAIRCRISSRATVALIDSRPDVREALDVSHAPSARAIQMAIGEMKKRLIKSAQSAQSSDESGRGEGNN